MTTLLSNLTSDYLKAYNLLKPKNNRKIIQVFVEDVCDVSFWYKVLSRFEAHNNVTFEISPFSNDNALTTGKCGLEKIFSNTGLYLIICLDSDYDYFLKDRTLTSKEINENPFIFQTYSYSIENIKCYAENLSKICKSAAFSTTELIDFPELLELYSTIIYDLFIWNLYFYSINEVDTFTIAEFCSLIKISENPDISTFGSNSLENLNVRVNNKLTELEGKHQNHKDKVSLLTVATNELGLSKSNTYLFVHGHTIYDNVVLMKRVFSQAVAVN